MSLVLGRGLRAVTLVFAVTLARANGIEAQSAPPRVAALKGEIKVLAAVIDQTMAQTFAPPFGLLEKTKGTYLPDFGLVFSLEVNLYPARTPSPFDMRPVSKVEVESAERKKLERIETVKKSVPRLLADNASGLRDVSPEETVAVVTHLFQAQTEGGNLPTQLVVEVKKSDLDQYEDKKLSFEGLVAKMKTLEL